MKSKLYLGALLLLALGLPVARAISIVNPKSVFDGVVEESSVVAHITVVRAEALELHEVQAEAGQVSNCGFNVKARIETAYKGSYRKFVEFSTDEQMDVGGEYLAFMKPEENASWYLGNWFGRSEKDELGIAEVACVRKLKYLKSDASPQRLIPLDSDGMLHVSRSDIAFPETVEFSAVQLGGLESGMDQDNAGLVVFSSLDAYLKKITSGNKKKE
ncbi:MAG: hypothetical protein ACREO1_15315 [Arenimonas sp.]